ncbi:DUF1642 domain-containing protein [Streptococcus parauberis]|uniref:DUF1642 domain-containing protein n=1 Tax=Streptococcus parauberis TaxID=1348 RepID=UPI0037909DC4
MAIEEYELGQKVSLYGIIEEINIEDIYDKENTTTLSIKTVTGKIHVNPKWEEVKLDQPKTILKKEHAEWLEDLKNEFPDNLPNQLYYITRQGWGYGLVFETISGQKRKISHLDGGKLKKDLVNALIYGYTVEKEKLYTVEIPNPNSGRNNVTILTKKYGNGLVLAFSDDGWKLLRYNKLTEAEIRKDFDWAWQWAKEVTE